MLVLRGDWQRLGDGELPLAPLATALRATPDAVLASVAPRGARRTRRRVPPALAVRRARRSRPPEADRHAQRRLFDSMWCLLMDLSDRTPVLLVIEDFHWVDRATREFVGFLALGAAPGADRDGDHLSGSSTTPRRRRWRCWRICSASTASSGSTCRPCHARASRRSRAGCAAAGRRRGSWTISTGVRTATRSSPSNCWPRWTAGRTPRLPAGVTNVVLQRLRHVSPPTQHLLRVAAVFRRPVDLGSARRRISMCAALVQLRPPSADGGSATSGRWRDPHRRACARLGFVRPARSPPG